MCETETKKKFNAIDGETLMDMNLPRTKFVIKGILPQGLAIIAGCADTIFTLDRSKRSQNSATLICTGRDIEYREFELNFNKDDCVWDLIADSSENPDMLMPDEMNLLIEMMKEIENFNGSNAEFVNEYNSRTGKNMTARLLKRMMNKWSYELEENGVYFESFRDKNVRGLKIRYEFVGDDGDVKYDENTAL